MCASERFVHLQCGLVVPLAAVEVALAIERAGHRLTVDGSDLVIQTVAAVDRDDLAELRRWKPHVRLFLTYIATDTRQRDGQPALNRGAIMLSGKQG
jgi:hypothetical protein